MHRLVCIQRFGLYAVNSTNKREYLDDTIPLSIHLGYPSSFRWMERDQRCHFSSRNCRGRVSSVVVAKSKRCKEMRSNGEPAFQKVEIKCIERDVGKLLARIEFLAFPLSTQFIAPAKKSVRNLKCTRERGERYRRYRG